MILVDTSVWISHFQKSLPELVARLEAEEVATHPFVIGELALGHLRRRSEILADLRHLPLLGTAGQEEAMHWVEKRRLHGKGIGWVDLHLLLSCLLDGAALWTQDRRLSEAARLCGLRVHTASGGV